MTDAERLLGLVGLLHSDLDLPAMLRRISEVARDLLRGESAGVVMVHGAALEIRVLTDLLSPGENRQFPYAHSSMEALDAAGTDVLVVVDGRLSRPSPGW